MFTNIVSGGNQHNQWLYCRQCDASGAVQTLDLMSCVNCSLRHIYQPAVDMRKTCVWTKWLRLISRYRLRMTDPERSQMRKAIQQCQEHQRLGIPANLKIHQEMHLKPKHRQMPRYHKKLRNWMIGKGQFVRKDCLFLLAMQQWKCQGRADQLHLSRPKLSQVKGGSMLNLPPLHPTT